VGLLAAGADIRNMARRTVVAVGVSTKGHMGQIRAYPLRIKDLDATMPALSSSRAALNRVIG
jgi:hypothetical protein